MASDRNEPSLTPDFGRDDGSRPAYDIGEDVQGVRSEPISVEPIEPVEPINPQRADSVEEVVSAERDDHRDDGDADSTTQAGGDGSQQRGQQAGAETPDLHLPVDPNKMTPRIGEILVAAGKLGGDQVDRVLDDQERHPEKRFGEIAVDRRFTAQRDVDAALASQFGFSSSSGLDAGLPAEIVVAHSPYSPFAEALRGLRSQLMLRWFDGSPQQGALALTSVDRGDGKSFICSNLGVVFSQLGEKTLIIDADLRNSTQHKKFGLPNKMGLSGMLSGRAGVEEILAVQGLSNLAILPAGPLPPNPQELLGREAFGRLLAGLAKSFDVILVDTPSAQQASDAQVVAQRARAALIVGRKDKTKSTEISQLADVMSGSGIKILGAALNDY